MEKNFSLRRAINAHIAGRPQDEAEQRAIDEARKTGGVDARTVGVLPIPVTTRAALTASDNPNIKTDTAGVLLPLEDSVLAKAGFTILTGLVGNLRVGSHTGVEASWLAEGEAVEDGEGKFREVVTLKPKRLSATVTISKQLLAQTGAEFDVLVEKLITGAVMDKLEATIFGAGKGDEKTPAGLFANAESLGAVDWEKIVDLESDLAAARALTGALSYITHPLLLTKAKKTLKDVTGGGGFIANGNINGYPAHRTANVADKMGSGTDEYGVAFGNWSDFYIGQWGPIQITHNPYTRAFDDEMILVLESYWDFASIRKESFAIATMK